MPAEPLISCDLLAQQLGRDGLVVLDCRHSLTNPGAGEAAYRAGHIPGARHVNLDRDLSRPPGHGEGRHPLPDPGAFAASLRRLGVSNESHVVLYDDCSGAMAARLWWMLSRWLGHTDVRVLDGGIAAWTSSGRELDQGTEQWESGTFVVGTVVDRAVVSTDELIELLGRGAIMLLDARAAGRFDGLMEPIDPVAGHVPGAVNLPFSELLDGDGVFLTAGHLRELFSRTLGGSAPADVVAMCGSGVTACHLLLGMQAAGIEGGRLYVGSWSEWITDPARPIAPEHVD